MLKVSVRLDGFYKCKRQIEIQGMSRTPEGSLVTFCITPPPPIPSITTIQTSVTITWSRLCLSFTRMES